MKYLFDTNICVALLTGRTPPVAQLEQHQPEDFRLCSVVKAELLYGARKSARVEANLQLLAAFFSQFESLPFDDRAAAHYGLVRALLAKAGAPIGANDLLIASIGLANDLAVVTRNRHEFLRVPGLRCELW